jgi:hypothetical protein
MEYAMRDRVRSGQYYSADYLRITNLDDNNATFQTMYKLIRCKGKKATDSGVISAYSVFGCEDDSAVFRVQSINPCVLFASWEFNTNQTSTVLIPAPEDDSRIVIQYGSIRSESVSGEAYFHDGSFKAFQIYFSNASSFVAGELYIPLEVGEALKLTSTQGAKKIYAAVNYFIEQVA